MARNVSPDHFSQALWPYLADSAEEQGKPLQLRVAWPGRPDEYIDVVIANNQPRAVVDDQLLALLDRIDLNELLPRLANDAERAAWRRYETQIKTLRGKTASLQSAASGVLVPRATK